MGITRLPCAATASAVKTLSLDRSVLLLSIIIGHLYVSMEVCSYRSLAS